jgi:hypothetical protein
LSGLRLHGFSGMDSNARLGHPASAWPVQFLKFYIRSFNAA